MTLVAAGAAAGPSPIAWRSILFLAMCTFLWVTTTPYSDLDAVRQQAATGSNIVNQVVALTLTASMLLTGFIHSSRSHIVRPGILIVALFAWYALASFLSPYPFEALKRLLLAALTCGSASVFLFLPRSEQHFAKLLAAGMLIMLGCAYFGVIVLPSRSIHLASDLVEPENAGLWRGQYTHKNEAAAVMLNAVFFGLFIRTCGLRWLGLIIVAAAAFFLVHTGGKSSTAMLPIILILSYAFERWRVTRMPIAIGGIVVFNAVVIGAAISKSFSSFVASLGIDPTFTNRTDIWAFSLENVQMSPLFGFGFQGFWQTEVVTRNVTRLESWASLAFNGHNAYLDALLTTGVPGLLLTLLWVWIVPTFYAGRAFESGNDPALTRLYLRIWLYGLYTACLESIFFQSGSSVWFMMMVSIFGLQLQAQARLSEGADPGRQTVLRA